MKIGLIGNTNWQNKRKIRDILFELKRRFGDDLIVISGGGKEGANYMIKKFALEFNITYQEYNPSFSGKNLYSMMPESYYGKKYHFSQLHHRMKLLVKNCDRVMIITNETKLDPVLKTAYNESKKCKIPIVLLG